MSNIAEGFERGPERDLTRTVQFTVAPADMVHIDSTGLVTPLKEGKATVTASHQGASATIAGVIHVPLCSSRATVAHAAITSSKARSKVM